MQNYKTVEEKAAEWNISTRHIQFLCRSDKVEGAVKRAGSWFIPGDTPSPAKNTKAGADNFNFVGSKKRIFHSATELFMLKGFENVSLKEIGSRAGIRQSTIYNHFKSKQEILDTIYDFYCYHYLENRPSLKGIEKKLKNKNLMEIFEYIRYDFHGANLQEMSDITKIIFQRIGIDIRAREIAKSLMLDGAISYVEKIFDKAIELGKLSSFDTHTIATFVNGIRIFILFHWMVDSSQENITRLFEDEQKLYELAGELLSGSTPSKADT